MCHIFYPKAKTECVNQCLQELHDHIRWIKIPEDTLDEKQTVDTPSLQRLTQYWLGHHLPKSFQVYMSTEDPEEETETNKNKYHCSGILDALMKDYLPIFPLWSGIMRGDNDLQKTRDTNCHAENWFCIVKTKLYRKKYHHPAAFIQKMYASLQGRHREHILQHDLPDRILQKGFSVKKTQFGGL